MTFILNMVRNNNKKFYLHKVYWLSRRALCAWQQQCVCLGSQHSGTRSLPAKFWLQGILAERRCWWECQSKSNLQGTLVGLTRERWAVRMWGCEDGRTLGLIRDQQRSLTRTGLAVPSNCLSFLQSCGGLSCAPHQGLKTHVTEMLLSLSEMDIHWESPVLRNQEVPHHDLYGHCQTWTPVMQRFTWWQW